MDTEAYVLALYYFGSVQEMLDFANGLDEREDLPEAAKIPKDQLTTEQFQAYWSWVLGEKKLQDRKRDEAS